MKLLIDYAMQYVGVHYKWGGANYLTGLDCSGFAQEILASAGVDPPGDQTAQTLYDHFAKQAPQLSIPQVGALVFFGKDTRNITHVAICLDYYRVIEAGGGGSSTISRDIAAQQGAMIRVRPIDRRSDRVAILLPKYRP